MMEEILKQQCIQSDACLLLTTKNDAWLKINYLKLGIMIKGKTVENSQYGLIKSKKGILGEEF